MVFATQDKPVKPELDESDIEDFSLSDCHIRQRERLATYQVRA